MANLGEAFQTFNYFEAKRMREPREVTYQFSYDTTCPTCGNHGYCVTNDGGSIGGCTKCNKTYASKATKIEVITEKGKEISRRIVEKVKNESAKNIFNSIENRRCRICNLPRNNHNVYHLFE